MPVLLTGKGAVTRWPWLQDAERATWRDVGSLVRRLHDIPSDEVSAFREKSNCHDIYDLLPLTQERLEWIATYRPSAAVDRFILALRTLRPVVSDILSSATGLVHLDARPSNTLALDGTSLLIDTDHLCIGPPEWDLMRAIPSTARSADLARGIVELEEVTAGYGSRPQHTQRFQTLLAFRWIAYSAANMQNEIALDTPPTDETISRTEGVLVSVESFTQSIARTRHPPGQTLLER
jgi:aminoglycoside phosphotransferase (APT) family kinase protein